ncbi:hypothetical protein V1527DRAFT_497234 [Lipomyces starkeyi]
MFHRSFGDKLRLAQAASSAKSTGHLSVRLGADLHICIDSILSDEYQQNTRNRIPVLHLHEQPKSGLNPTNTEARPESFYIWEFWSQRKCELLKGVDAGVISCHMVLSLKATTYDLYCLHRGAGLRCPEFQRYLTGVEYFDSARTRRLIRDGYRWAKYKDFVRHAYGHVRKVTLGIGAHFTKLIQAYRDVFSVPTPPLIGKPLKEKINNLRHLPYRYYTSYKETFVMQTQAMK